MTVRTRFAPSPTGMFHVGNARSLLYNWLAAEQAGGQMVLRIEDTDAERSKPEWIDGILKAMAWLGVDSSQYEGPYFQTDNAARHAEAVAALLDGGHAYYCDCTREQIAERTGDPHKGYDGHCRTRDLGPGPGRAVRFRTPDTGETVVTDLVRGAPVFPNAALEDFVVARSDGTPTFLLANIVDDMAMGITLVIRAEEHLSNTPKQQLLWEALGATPPTWAHAPILVNDKRQKLSKRRDKAALEDFARDGYLPEAMRNYLMLLGWAPPDGSEILPWQQIVDRFRIADVNPAPAFFDVKKLRAFNGDYLRAMSATEFAAVAADWLAVHFPAGATWADDRDRFAAATELAQTRIAILSELPDMIGFLFTGVEIDPASWDKALKPGAVELLTDALGALGELGDWTADAIKDTIERAGQAHGLKLSKAQAPVRVAVTGRTVGLPLFESMQLLGRPETLDRVAAALSRANPPSPR
ncbi:glutamate--tRNA ligase [Actinomadura harenae]|uniref:Glutamate--tRNA ligase n=1 Tax=Actinomadura harenae TaxID=2483351 RepID=A0A3M2M4S7_9ACTN|nr:glutamate--tRNA ligase [Actinomadura harenae]